MGVKGLLPLMKPYMPRCHLSQLKGATAAVDISCFIAKGLSIYNQAAPAAEFAMTRIYQLVSAGIDPIVVFDGQTPKIKYKEVQRRRDAKMKHGTHNNLTLGAQGFSSSPKFAKVVQLLRRRLHEEKITAVGAPYEADPQCASFTKTRDAHFVVTEDSDLIHLGCQHVLYKLDSQGWGDLYSKNKAKRFFGKRSNRTKRLELMCSLLGNDYNRRIHTFGPQKIVHFIAKLKKPKSMTDQEIKDRIAQCTNESVKKRTVPGAKKYPANIIKIKRTAAEHIKNRRAANFSRRHHVVLSVQDLDNLKHVRLTDVEGGIPDEFMDIAGFEELDKEIIKQKAFGNIDRDGNRTSLQIDPIDGDEKYPITSLWSRDHKKIDGPLIVHPVSDEAQSDYRPYKCLKCGKGFIYRSHYYMHLSCFHVSDKNFKCSVGDCSRLFKTRLRVRRHILGAHMSDNYWCEECNIACKYKYSHIRRHRQNNYSCKYLDCTLTFGFRHEFQDHLKTHLRCILCEIGFKSPQLLDDHNRQSHFQCNTCSDRFTNELELTTHQKDHRQIAELYACDRCNYKFFKEEHLKHHFMLTNHNQKLSFQCFDCGKGFHTGIKLSLHKYQFHSIPRFQCPQCPRMFKTRSQLRYHVTGAHHKPKCLVCCEDMDSKQALKDHMNLVHSDSLLNSESTIDGEKINYIHKESSMTYISSLRKTQDTSKPFECLICHVRYTTRAGYLRHFREAHSAIRCTKCQRGFTTTQSLEVHMKKFKNCSLPEIRVHRCPHCSETHPTKDILMLHFKTAHPTIISDPKARHFQCSKCPKNYRELRTLAHHMRVVHPDDPSDIKRHQCSKCPKTYLTLEGLNHHMKTVHPKDPSDIKRHQCAKCPKNFLSLHGFSEHMRIVHASDPSEIKRYQCAKCPKNYLTSSGLTQHVKKVHPSNPSEIKRYQCPKCPKDYIDSSGLTQHIKKVHPSNPSEIKRCQCPKCPKNYTDSSGLDYHMRTAHPSDLSEIKRHQCPKCPKDYLDSSGLAHHMKIVHPEDPSEIKRHQCPKCPKDYLDPSKLAQHMKILHPVIVLTTQSSLLPEIIIHRCTHCSETYPTKDILELHLMTAHPTNISEPGVRHFQCSECPRNYLNSDGLAKHMKTVHPKDPSDIKRHQCTKCPKNYLASSGLTYHMLTVHPADTSETKPYKCSKCQKSFVSVTHLSYHLDSSHAPQQCELCHEIFKSKRAKKNHMNLVHSKHSHIFECTSCTSKFARSTDLKNHILNSHQKIQRTYECSVCHLLYNSIGYLRYHMSTIHSTIRCVICTKGFATQKNLDTHMKNYHTDIQQDDMDIEILDI